MSYYRWGYLVYKNKLTKIELDEIGRDIGFGKNSNAIELEDGRRLKEGQIVTVTYPENIYVYAEEKYDEKYIREEIAKTLNRMIGKKQDEIRKLQEQERIMRMNYFDVRAGDM